MKKFVSILLVAMLILSLFPATAMPAKAAGGTFTRVTSVADITSGGSFVIVGEASGSYKAMPSADLSSSTKISGTAVTVSNGKITVADDSLVWTVAGSGSNITLMGKSKYLAYASSTNIKSQTGTYNWTITESSTDGLFQLAAPSTTRGLIYRAGTENKFGAYAASNLTNNTTEYKYLQFFKLGDETTEPDVPACDHVGYDTYEGDDGVAGSCTVDKVTATVYCSNCDGVVTQAVTTPAPGHNYVGGVCSVCGAEKPNGYAKVDNVATLTATDKVVITMTLSNGNVYALTNGGGTSSAPAATKVTVTNGVIEDLGANATNLVWNVDYDGGNITIYPDGTTATWLYCTSTNNGVRVGTNTNKIFTISGNYLKHTSTGRFVGIYNSQDWRCYTTNTGSSNIANQTLAFYKLETGTSSDPVCDHEGYETYLGTDGKSASCTEDGATASVYCSNCDGKITASTVIPATGHNYVDGECTVCHTPDPFINLPGTYYIATKRSEGNYWYMTSTVTSTRYVAEEAAATLPSEIEDPELDKIFRIVNNNDGTFSIQAVGVEGDNYLGWTSGNSGILVAATAANTKFTPEYNEETSTYQFHFTGSDGERYLSLNGTDGNDYFAWYKGTQKQDLSLIPAEIPAAEPVINGYVGNAWVGFTSVEAALSETSTLQLIGENTPAIECQGGNLYLDLNGYDATVTATKIYAYDSSATSAAAGTGTLTTTSNVEFDYTANSNRYIALKDGNNYTFHVLDLALTGVTLRTTAAGIYYKATVTCDSTLLGKITNYGVLLSINGAPTEFDASKNAWTNIATATTALESGKAFTSGSVFGIFKDGMDNATRGTTPIYANAYIMVDGQTLMTTAHAEYSMYDVVTEVNKMNFATMKPELYQALGDFYNDWADVMDAWGMAKLSNEFGSN